MEMPRFSLATCRDKLASLMLSLFCGLNLPISISDKLEVRRVSGGSQSAGTSMPSCSL